MNAAAYRALDLYLQTQRGLEQINRLDQNRRVRVVFAVGRHPDAAGALIDRPFKDPDTNEPVHQFASGSLVTVGQPNYAIDPESLPSEPGQLVLILMLDAEKLSEYSSESSAATIFEEAFHAESKVKDLDSDANGEHLDLGVEPVFVPGVGWVSPPQRARRNSPMWYFW